MKRGAWAVVFISLALATDMAWSGPIYETVAKVPSDLRTQLGPQSRTVQKFTSIACYDAANGSLANCSFDFSITGLAQPALDVANNGGHTHDLAAHPLGTLREIAPVAGNSGVLLSGQTGNDIIVVSHVIPDVSGRIDTILNLRVPPGWHTVYPESFDETHTSWQFITTIDVGVTRLEGLQDGSASYTKLRNPPSGDTAHTDAVAFSGTADARLYLGAIADAYFLLGGHPLSINDMSLPKGGLFDANARLGQNIYATPHKLHRTGQSADINKTQGDCLQNTTLRAAVDMIMPIIYGSPFARRNPPSRFLCETGNHNNIHIDFDVVPPPSPSVYQ